MKLTKITSMAQVQSESRPGRHPPGAGPSVLDQDNTHTHTYTYTTTKDDIHLVGFVYTPILLILENNLLSPVVRHAVHIQHSKPDFSVGHPSWETPTQRGCF